jgi:hypothetical protein
VLVTLALARAIVVRAKASVQASRNPTSTPRAR